LPYTALIKTYETDAQTADSAGTMTAIVTGVKTRSGHLSVNQNVEPGDHTAAAGNNLVTILELAEKAGLATGVVTTTRITHATPAACYAHSPARDWEDDSALPPAAKAAGFSDIARQLAEFAIGDGIEVVLGGGRANFLPHSMPDPEYPDKKGRRKDGKDLTERWSRLGSVYAWNAKQFAEIDVSKVEHVLGLFEPSHMQYEHDRSKDKGGEPSLSEMTAKAIEMLSRNPKGFFLMVEGGRIDHAHHAGNAFRALSDTVEFARAVQVARDKTRREDTLMIVTADHSHVFTMAGYPIRGNPILGKVEEVDQTIKHTKSTSRDKNGLPYTTLGYANGPGYVPGSRPDLSNTDTAASDYRQECTIPLESETHSGEDVPLYADGPQAHLFRGVLEQNVVFHVMAEALGLVDAAAEP
jgi:alkaline phosphatase